MRYYLSKFESKRMIYLQMDVYTRPFYTIEDSKRVHPSLLPFKDYDRIKTECPVLTTLDVYMLGLGDLCKRLREYKDGNE